MSRIDCKGICTKRTRMSKKKREWESCVVSLFDFNRYQPLAQCVLYLCYWKRVYVCVCVCVFKISKSRRFDSLHSVNFINCSKECKSICTLFFCRDTNHWELATHHKLWLNCDEYVKLQRFSAIKSQKYWMHFWIVISTNIQRNSTLQFIIHKTLGII